MIHVLFLLSAGFLAGAIVGECDETNDNWIPAFLIAIATIVLMLTTIFLVAKGW